MRLDLTHVLDGFDREHNFPITPLHEDVIQLVARSRAVYDPTLLMTYGGPSGDAWYWTRADLHDDPKIRHLLPHDYVHRRTWGQPWIREDENVLPRLAADAASILRSGGTVTVGGHGDFLGVGYHQNLWALADGGLTPLEALQAATLAGARAIGHGEDLGSIEVGKLADLLVLNANPLEDIRNSESLRYVMKDGTLYEAGTLAELWPHTVRGPVFWWNAVEAEAFDPAHL